tara:strand:- start:302 stop:436 length:135 start_codon:yes stop_codon:yes gene_type:complete
LTLALNPNTASEQAAYAKVMGGAAMTQLLAGDGYYQVVNSQYSQ